MTSAHRFALVQAHLHGTFLVPYFWPASPLGPEPSAPPQGTLVPSCLSPAPDHRGMLQPHGHTNMHPTCTPAHAHAHMCSVFCQARCPPQSRGPLSPPLVRARPAGDSPFPNCRPPGEEGLRAGAPLTNLETLNRGNTVLPASLPPLAGALVEGQERRKVVNDRPEARPGQARPRALDRGARMGAARVGRRRAEPWQLPHGVTWSSGDAGQGLGAGW